MELIAHAKLAAVDRRKTGTAALSPAERRTLGGVLGFLAGLAALGPIAALGAAFLGALAAHGVRGDRRP